MWSCGYSFCRALSHVYSHHQLSDVAEGLQFLHSQDVIHGNLKGVRDFSEPRFVTALTCIQSNILIDGSGFARITDFGLATVTKNLDSVRSASDYQGQAARWTAPEILKDNGAFTTAVDVFSFAMVMIEVRYEWAVFIKLWLTATWYHHRYLPTQFRSVILNLQQWWWQ